MKLSHKIEIKPNKAQAQYLTCACGVARFTYNWALNHRIKAHKAGEKLTRGLLKAEFNQIKYTEFPFVTDVTKCASEQALANLDAAYQRFFKKQARFPKFKKKGARDSFYIANDQLKIEPTGVRIPKLGWVKTTEALRLKGKILSAIVSRRAHKWFISIAVELAEDQVLKACENQAAIGVDLGIKTLATLSTGETIEGPKPLKKNLKKLRRADKRLSRRVKGSKNREKARKHLARIHYHVACIRKDSIDKLTTYLCENFKIICIEDLATSNMLKNHKLARAIADMGWGEFKRQLVYKSELYSNELRIIGRFVPTSKTCCCCGNIKEDLKLYDRVYECGCCGLVLDRDLNAAINICTVGLTETGLADLREAYACGDISSGENSCSCETDVIEARTRYLEALRLAG